MAQAGALAHQSRLVLLDEFDAPVHDELRRLQVETGLSTVLVAHDPEEAVLLADEVLVVADGCCCCRPARAPRCSTAPHRRRWRGYFGY